jgi:hypothetical protein
MRIRPVTSGKGVQSALEGILQTLQEDEKLLYFAAFVVDPLEIQGHKSAARISNTHLFAVWRFLEVECWRSCWLLKFPTFYERMATNSPSFLSLEPIEFIAHTLTLFTMYSKQL